MSVKRCREELTELFLFKLSFHASGCCCARRYCRRCMSFRIINKASPVASSAAGDCGLYFDFEYCLFDLSVMQPDARAVCVLGGEEREISRLKGYRGAFAFPYGEEFYIGRVAL